MELFQAVKNDNLLPKKYFFIGDGAFTNTTQFLSPWPGKATILMGHGYHGVHETAQLMHQ